MHKLVVENVSEYLELNKDLTRFFDRLRNANKKMFLVTNSPFHFVYVFQISIICSKIYIIPLIKPNNFYMIFAVIKVCNS